ncbi:uncharacterized protein I206_103811 [Kwoniella pini CBS 10737]|uniref:Uncharacterized protein n=1 Tax=Kwoniella pini CBS 10737 TaxID=1296096 RepID=A0A1B9HSM8_9TREE|nr:uncharacterized protein I206_07763 [Kwoniella pini CBS 10737]OCF46283.1 hypothetical protein I206_07763 [Kwoniella pini CBS 10737]
MSKLQAQWELEERKLQSVYDDVSSHRLAPAQSTLTRYLKKNPKSQPALILKLYINQKLGSADDDELLKSYKQIKSLGEMTGRGVWWVGLIFRNMGRTDLALDLYDELSNKHSDNPALLEQVFLHAAAANNVESLVNSSRKLFNLTRDQRWARSSAWSEWLKNAPQPTPSVQFPSSAPTNSLKIALLLLNTSKSPQHTSETLWLKAQILLSSGQLQEALKFLKQEGKHGGTVRLWWRMEFAREILRRMSDQEYDREVLKKGWEDEIQWVTQLFKSDKESQRNYAYYRHLLLSFESLLLLSNIDNLKSVSDLLHDLELDIGKRERSPLLAQLELQSILRKHTVESDVVLDSPNWLKAVEKYWIQWGSKGSVVSELEGIVFVNEPEKKRLVAEFMEKQASQQHTDEQSYREQVNAHIYLLRFKSSDWTFETQAINVYWQLYLSGLQYGKNLPKTDVNPANQIGLITVSLLMELWSKDKSKSDLIVKSIMYLEYIVKNSPACAHARYLLIRLYRLIGASSLIAPHLTSLKISEIQLDNLLHVFTERGAAESIYSNNQEIWTDHMKKSGEMYQRTSIDFPEYVKESLSNETYSKIHSIQYIHKSLSNSITNHSRTIEQARLATYISAPFGTKLMKKLDLAIESIPIDLRNWELIFEIGGNRPLIKDLTTLGGSQINENWIKSFARLYRDLGVFINGEKVENGEISIEGLLPYEASLISNANKLLVVASKALSGAEGVSEMDLKMIFTENIQIISSSFSSRWEEIQAFTCLYELIKIFDMVLNHLIEFNKSLKGKNKSSVLVQLINDLKAIKDTLKEDLKPALKRLEELNKLEVDWQGINENWIEDENSIELGQNINTSRKDCLIKIKSLLAGIIDVPKNINNGIGKKK